MQLMRPTRASPLWLIPWAPRRRRVFIHHQVQVHEVLGGVEMGPVSLDHQGPHGVKTCPAGRGEIETGAGDGDIERL